jgi:hypothetical protein
MFSLGCLKLQPEGCVQMDYASLCVLVDCHLLVQCDHWGGHGFVGLLCASVYLWLLMFARLPFVPVARLCAQVMMACLLLSDLVSHVFLSSGVSEPQVALCMLTRHYPWIELRVSNMFGKRSHAGPPWLESTRSCPLAPRESTGLSSKIRLVQLAECCGC